MITEKQIIDQAAGNPGAAMALTLLMGYRPDIVQKILDYGLKGTDIYVLWSDICDKNQHAVARLVEQCPKDLLIDACSRQDYSGKGLVKPYLFADHV